MLCVNKTRTYPLHTILYTLGVNKTHTYPVPTAYSICCV